VQRALKSDADVDVRLAMDIIDLQLSNVEVLRDALGARNGLSPSEREAEAQDAERVAEEDAIMQAELVRCPRWIPQPSLLLPARTSGDILDHITLEHVTRVIAFAISLARHHHLGRALYTALKMLASSSL